MTSRLPLFAWPDRVMGRAFDRVYVAGGRYACYNQQYYRDAYATALDRSTGFDWTLFQVMIDDHARVAPYDRDLQRHVAGRTVLEIGPGPVALLTRLALAAGARSVVSVEGNASVARRAATRLARDGYADRARVVSCFSDDLTREDTGGVTHFDVLLLECYHAVAAQERVVETVATLREHGFTFDRVISRGFECLVSPAAAPEVSAMSPFERILFGWPTDATAAQEAMRTSVSSLHGDLARVDALRLAAPQVWQSCDLERDAVARTRAVLGFDGVDLGRYAGLLFTSRFWFHDGEVLDTATTPTGWGAYWAPLGLPAAITTGAAGAPATAPAGAPATSSQRRLRLETVVADPTRPSEVELTARVGDVRSDPLRL